MTRDRVNAILSTVLPDALSAVWWDLRLPSLGGSTANELFEKGRGDEVLEYVLKYTEE